jgi:hypothetical protein
MESAYLVRPHEKLPEVVVSLSGLDCTDLPFSGQFQAPKPRESRTEIIRNTCIQQPLAHLHFPTIDLN